MKSIHSYIGNTRFLFALALCLLLSMFMSPVFAHDGGSQSGGQSSNGGGYVVGGIGGYAGGGYDVTTGTGTGWGQSASDVGGGNGTQSGVVNNGWSKQYSTGYDHSAAGASTELGLGYANTATSGNNTAYNYSVGKTYGTGATGTANGAAGGDFSGEAHGNYTVSYQGAQGDIYGGIVIGAFGDYGQYSNYNGYGHN